MWASCSSTAAACRRLGAAVHLPIFDAGRLKARYGADAGRDRFGRRELPGHVVSAARDVATQATTRAQIEAQRTPALAARSTRRSNCKAVRAARVRQGVTDVRSRA